MELKIFFPTIDIHNNTWLRGNSINKEKKN